MAESYVRVAGTVTPKDQDPIDISFNVECDAIVKAEVEIETEAADQEIDLAGIAAESGIVFVLLIPDQFTEEVEGTPDLGYKVEADTGNLIKLGKPHIYSPGMDEGLGVAGELFSKIFVSNASTTVAPKLTVVVGYNT